MPTKKEEFSINSSSSTKTKHRDSYEIRKQIKRKVSKYDFETELAITQKIKKILEGAQDYEFDMFELNKASFGNEMIVLSTYLLNKHDLFVN